MLMKAVCGHVRGIPFVFFEDYTFFTFPSVYTLMEFVSTNFKFNWYVLAEPESAQLIGFLYKTFVDGKISRPKVLSSLYVDDSFIPTSDSFKYLYSLVFKRPKPVSLGGPRPICFDDFFYSVINMSQAAAPNTDILELARAHSFWLPSKFFTVTDEESFGRILGVIGDPRWYIFYKNNTRRYKVIYHLLGLYEEDFCELPFNTRFSPAKYCLDAWFLNTFAYEAFSNYSAFGIDKLDASLIGLRPGDVLYRKLWLELKNSNSLVTLDSIASPLYKITKFFITTLVDMWIAFLDRKKSTEPLFLAEDVFTKEEAEAFNTFFAPFLS